MVSLNRQIRSCQAWLPAAWQPFAAAGIPRDGGMADLLTEAKAPLPRFAAVVCEDIERSARDTFNALKLEKELSRERIPLFATDSTFAVMRGHAAASSQARRMAWISSHVGRSRRDGLNRAVIRTRRSLAAMSAVDGWVLVLYQGAPRRRASVSAGWCPAAAYQTTATAWQARAKGSVRSTAAAARFRAWPHPKTCLLSSIAVSVSHR